MKFNQAPLEQAMQRLMWYAYLDRSRGKVPLRRASEEEPWQGRIGAYLSRFVK